MNNANMTVNVSADGFTESLARNLREAADRLDPQPIDRDELKAVIVSAGDAPAEIADAVAAWLGAGASDE